MAKKLTHAHEADNGLAEKILSGEAYLVEADNADDVVNDQLHALNVSANNLFGRIAEIEAYLINLERVSSLVARIAVIEAYLVHLGKTMGHNGTPQFIPHGENDD